jgi:hypothetical protein
MIRWDKGRGKRPRRRRRRRGEETPRPIRWHDLAGLCDLVSLVRVEGRQVPVISPRRHHEDPCVFDAAVVATGLPEFIRPRHDADWPAEVAHLAVGCATWVRDLGPGVRCRLAVNVYFPTLN